MASNLKSMHLFTPAVGKRWLYFSAGIVWLGVGIMLIGFASRWLKLVTLQTWVLLVLSGVALAAGIYFFGFSKVARKNIRRIYTMAGGRVCLFAFQERKSYPLVLFMIALGIYLRIYSPIPKPLLAVLYMGIGGGLLSSSLHYFKQVFKLHVSTLSNQKREEIPDRLPPFVISGEKDVQ
jgi:hypothetical protein